MSEWKPIATGPKDGGYVLLSNQDGTWVGKYEGVYQSGYKPDNPWISVMLNHRHMVYGASHVPSHWMPLPSPPEERRHESQTANPIA